MKTVLTCGTFDILHPGHIHMFQKAREYGDRLVVCVARDVNAHKIKGAEPFYNEETRKMMLENLTLVDEVHLGGIEDPYEIISTIKPDVIALGYDQKIFVDNLVQKITNLGLEIQIVRLAPFNSDKFKSGNIKKYLKRIL